MKPIISEYENMFAYYLRRQFPDKFEAFIKEHDNITKEL